MPAILLPGRGAKGLRPGGPAVRLNTASPQAQGLSVWVDVVGGSPPAYAVGGGGAAPSTLAGNAIIRGQTLGGSAVQCDGAGDYASMPMVPAMNFHRSPQWTVDCWLYWDATSSYPEVYSVNKGASHIDRLVCAFFDPSTVYFVVMTSDQGLIASTGTNPFTTGSWQLFTATRNGTALNLYRNGVSFRADTLSGALGSNQDTTDFYWGKNHTTGGTDLNGRVAMWRAWTRPLSANEVWSLYANPWDLYWVPGRRVFFDVGAAAGRTTKNTRAFPLGIEVGMGWRMPA